MSGASDFLEIAILNFWLRGNPDALVAPPTVYISLHTGDPVDTGSNEVGTTGTGYTRQAVGTATGFTAPVTDGTRKVVSNAAEIAWPAAGPSNWGSVAYFGIWDAASGGNFLLQGILDFGKTINAGDVFRFPAGALKVTSD